MSRPLSRIKKDLTMKIILSRKEDNFFFWGGDFSNTNIENSNQMQSKLSPTVETFPPKKKD